MCSTPVIAMEVIELAQVAVAALAKGNIKPMPIVSLEDPTPQSEEFYAFVPNFNGNQVAVWKVTELFVFDPSLPIGTLDYKG
jgi:hypothetical protein